jgi:hypothetical protein
MKRPCSADGPNTQTVTRDPAVPELFTSRHAVSRPVTLPERYGHVGR